MSVILLPSRLRIQKSSCCNR